MATLRRDGIDRSHFVPRRGFRGAGFGVEVWLEEDAPRRAAPRDERAERRRLLRQLRQELAAPPFWES